MPTWRLSSPAQSAGMTDDSQREEILVNVTPREVRAALLENGLLQEVHIERAARRGLISNIYKGKVVRVLPGMQAAFVDIGLERSAFLYVSDVYKDFLELEQLMLQNSIETEDPLSQGPDEIRQDPLSGISFNIEDLLQEGHD